METKLRILSGFIIMILSVVTSEVWAQNTDPTQTICPGPQPYYVVPGDVNSTFLWSISPAGGWEITPGADNYHITVTWANPVAQTSYTLSLTETTPGPDGCSTIQTITVTVNPLPAATISYSGTPYCASGTATVTQTGQGGGTYSSTAGLVIDGGTGAIDLAASTAGTYTVTYSFTDGTCANTTSASVTINALPTAAIAYSGSPYCASGTATVTQTGQGGGTFSSTAGLVIDEGTGAIDLVATTAGTYTVTYNFTDGTCANTTSASVTVNALPAAAIAYSGSPYCASGTATVTQTGQGGGTYSSTSGLVIDAGTGAIDLVASTAGTYTVTYSFSDGTCSNTTTASVTVNALPTATIAYSGSPYCATGTAAVTLTGQGGGTYSSTAGLVIDPATGTIDLVASTPGTFTVTYSISNGPCSIVTTSDITIIPLPATSPIWHN